MKTKSLSNSEYWASLVAQTVKNSASNTGDLGSVPGLRRSPGDLPAMWETLVGLLIWEIPWRREWLPTLVFLPGESYGQRSFVDYSPRGSQREGHD